MAGTATSRAARNKVLEFIGYTCANGMRLEFQGCVIRGVGKGPVAEIHVLIFKFCDRVVIDCVINAAAHGISCIAALPGPFANTVLELRFEVSARESPGHRGKDVA